jgi:hypothetical protein
MKTVNFSRHFALFIQNKYCIALEFCLVLALNLTNAQSTFTTGKYQLLLLNDTFYDISNSDTTLVTTDHMVIKLKDGITEAEQESFNSRYPITYSRISKYGTILYNINEGADFIELINNIAHDEDVELYDINHIIPLLDAGQPNDSYEDIWILINYGGYENLLWPYTHTNLFEAWTITTGSPDIIVADIDNGLWNDHPDISYGSDQYSNIWENTAEVINGENGIDDDKNDFIDDFYGWNFTNDNNNIWNLADFTHGTIMSGIIAAKTNNDLGVWGVAGGYSHQGIRILQVKCNNQDDPNGMSSDYINFAIDYAVRQGARVINMPFGGANEISNLHNTIQGYYNEGNVVFLSGTGDDRIDDPINGLVYYPAKYAEVIGVGATKCNPENLNDLENRWTYGPAWESQWGEGINVCAPGSPVTAHADWDGWQYSPSYDYYTTYQNGSTSRAVSFTSGVVALMLSATPCLTNQEAMDILQNTAYKFPYPGLEWDENGWNKYYGYGRIDALAALKPPINTITTSVTWSEDQKIFNDIIIEDQGVLTIDNCTISMQNWAKIIVKQGGVLILQNNAILSGLCNSSWQGIEVWGNRNASQYTPPGQHCAQGKLIIQNATIENAITAVELWKPGENNMTGGIVEAHDAVFLNNDRSVHAINYRNFNPYPPYQELDYYANFDNCSFILDENYLGEKTFYKHVDLDRVKGIKFYGCSFSLSHEAENVSAWNLGIAAYNAGFSVLPVCMTSTIPCEEYDSCRFNGFYWAIGAWSSSIPYPTQVRNAHFDDNCIGIYLSGVNYAIILDNFFEVGYDIAHLGDCGYATGYGIDNQTSVGFTFENNKFRKNSDAPTGIYAGIRVYWCPSVYDVIYQNEFIGLSYGNYAEGTNRSIAGDDAKGVEYQCNLNYNNAVDFIVTAGNPYNAMIRGPQGSREMSSGNRFSRYIPSVWHFRNEGTHIINYYYCDTTCTDEEPINIFTLRPEYFEKIISDANTCPDHYGGGGHIELTAGERQETEAGYAQNLNDYNSVSALYESLKDGGNTEAELANIQTAQPDEMWELRTQLLGHSPHLSQEVLREASDRTDVFPDEILLEILSSNPDELNKDTLLSYLEQKEDPLPEYMLDILRQAAQGVTYKTILQDEMARYHAAKTQAAQDILRSILYDTVFNLVDYRIWLDNLGGLVADKQIISSYLSENDTANAIALLNLLPSLYGLEGENLDDYNDYKILVEMQISWMAEGKTVYELDSVDIATLETFAVDGETSAGNIARNILTYGYNYHFCDCMHANDSSFYKSNNASFVNYLNEAFGPKISAEPNPARTWVAFNYELPEEQSEGLIRITDISGKVLHQFQVSGKIGQKIWDTRSVKPGLYFYVITVSGLSKSGKVIIN